MSSQYIILFYPYPVTTTPLLPITSVNPTSTSHPSEQHQVRILCHCPCPVRIPYFLPISSQNTTCSAHVQLEYATSPCSVSTPSRLPMPSQYTISPVHVQSVLFSMHVLSEYHLCCSLQSESYREKESIISPAHVQLIYYLSCRCLLSTSSLLPISSQYTTSPPQLKSVHHLIWPCLVRIPHLLYTISTAHHQSP